MRLQAVWVAKTVVKMKQRCVCKTLKEMVIDVRRIELVVGVARSSRRVIQMIKREVERAAMERDPR